mgnify:CR=1 FL=1
MASGVAIVASDVAGIPQVIVPGETGLLAPEKDPAALAQALVALVGFLIAGVPGAMALSALTFVLSFIPMGPALLWGGLGWGLMAAIGLLTGAWLAARYGSAGSGFARQCRQNGVKTWNGLPLWF